MLKGLLFNIGLLFLLPIFVFSQSKQFPEKLYSDRAVQDYIGLLTKQQILSLDEKLKKYEDSTSTGISIAIVNSIEDNINYKAAQVLTKWGLGQKGKDNGVLILLAYQQRQVAISTGYGVEDRLTDAMSRRIIEVDMIPFFKQNEYYQGLDSGTTAIIQTLQGAYKASSKNTKESWFDFFHLLL